MRENKNIENLLSCVKPDFIGFIFHEKSKRNVSDNVNVDFGRCKKVGVFVNKSRLEVLKIVDIYKLDIVQLHGDESNDDCEYFRANGLGVFKAFSISNDFDFETTKLYEQNCDKFIFDAKGENYGGNGIKYNWDLLKKYKGDTPFMLSGGININDTDDINSFKHDKFVGVDVNSGFEDSPGLKNIDVLIKFKEKIGRWKK